MAMLEDDSSLEALEALLAFRQRVTTSSSVHPEIPVPDPLNPLLPHVIEGDTTPVNRVRGRFSLTGVQRSMFNRLPVACHVPSVPNPLDLIAGSSADGNSASSTLSTQQQQSFSLPTSVSSSARTSSTDPPVVSGSSANMTVRTDKIQAALNSQPQRGKKRRNLNDQERLELTRTRNREHAKCTRMKKKARHSELVEIEKMYLILKAQQEMNSQRRTRLVNIIEGVSDSREQGGVKECPHVRHLKNLAREKLQHAQISIEGTAETQVALTDANSATVKVSVTGTDYASGETKTLTAFCTASFQAASADITSLSLFWVAPDCHQNKMFPSISALSFET